MSGFRHPTGTSDSKVQVAVASQLWTVWTIQQKPWLEATRSLEQMRDMS